MRRFFLFRAFFFALRAGEFDKLAFRVVVMGEVFARKLSLATIKWADNKKGPAVFIQMAD